MFIHHFFGGFGGVGREDEQIHLGGGWLMLYVDAVC